MNRRSFIEKSTITAAFSLTLAPTFADKSRESAKPFNLNYAPHEGMFAHHGGKNFIDQINFMHDQGFRGIEDNGMLKRSKEEQDKIAATLSKLDMMMGVFVVDGGDNWKTSLTSGKVEFRDNFVSTCERSVEVAKRINAKWMTVVPGFYDRSLPIGIQTANVIEALRRGAEIFEPHGLTMVLEPLSDTPDLFCGIRIRLMSFVRP